MLASPPYGWQPSFGTFANTDHFAVDVAHILVICSRTPWPLTGGAKLRLFNTAQILAQEHTVDILVIDESPVIPDRRKALRDRFNDVRIFTYPNYSFPINAARGLVSSRPLQTHYYDFAEVRQWLDTYANRYDLLYCNHIRTTEYARRLDIPKIVDFVDAISRTYENATGTGLWRILYPLETQRLRRYERTIAHEFDSSFIISESDRDHIGNESIRVLPNGVADQFLDAPPSAAGNDDSPPTLVFHGKMDYMPNVDAATWFADEIFPIVRARCPNTQFRIVGTNPTKRIRALDSRTGIEVTGYVESVVDELVEATVAVAPMREGSGMQNKVLEAMATSTPVVTTPLGADGIAGTSGQQFSVAKKPEEFAHRVTTLTDAPDYRHSLGKCGRKLIHERYTWETAASILIETVTDTLTQSTQHRR